MRLAFLLFLGTIFNVQSATTYFVDFAAGNDASAGTSTGTAWRTIPGTYKTDGSDYLNTAWGSITSSARIADNTTINIKSGTTHNSANGGFVWLGLASGAFYNGGYTNLVFQTDTTWGTGASAILDASGMTVGIAVFLIQIDGVTVRGLDIRNSSVDGIVAKEKAGTGDAITNLVFDGLSLFNNGTSFLDDTAGSGSGQINIRRAIGVTVTNCAMDGGNNFINGVLLGDNHKAVSGLVINCIATNHLGDLIVNDSGIGFKALNGSLTFQNCSSIWNLKGFDLGEQAGADAGIGGVPANILYKVINCTSISNAWGINFNGSADAYPGTITWYAINNLIIRNDECGMNTYSAPHNLYIVNNVFENNGLNSSSTPLYNASHIVTTPNDNTDLAHIHTYIFNNIFRGQRAGGGNNDTTIILNKYDGVNTDYTLTIDYNSYQQTGANTTFCLWSAYYGPDSAVFSFGANGPGHASGDWYNQYGNNTTPPALGTGHFNSDAHSKGTGATDTSLPSLNSDYTLTATYPGLNLSGQPWYISEMGLDRAGRARSAWDMGAFEFSSGTPTIIHGKAHKRGRTN